MAQRQDETVRTDEPIDTTGVIVEAEIPGDALVSLNVEGTVATDYQLDVSADGETWFEAEATYTGTDSVSDVFELGDRYLRLRVTSAAATGETADVTVQEAR